MATISRPLRHAIYSTFSPPQTDSMTLNYETEFYQLNTYGQFVIDFQPEFIFVPTIACPLITTRLLHNVIVTNCDSLVFPLLKSEQNEMETYVTAEEAFKYWNNGTNLWRLCSSIVGTKVYHGACGIIMDEYHNPLFIAGKAFVCNSELPVGDIAYFSKQVLTDTEDPVCKFLHRKIMPFLIQQDIKIQLEDLNKFILKPEIPKWGVLRMDRLFKTKGNDIFTNLLLNNIDGIVENIYL